METYISLLRGINVSGQKKIRMQDLKALYEALDFNRVNTYIQSGNVVFDAAGSEIRRRIEESIRKQFGFEVPVLLRTADEFGAIVQANPFLKQAGIDLSKLHVTFLEQVPDPSAIEALSKLQSGSDEYRVLGQEVYLHCPNGYGRSKLTNTALEKKLQIGATTRNWKTVLQLYGMAGPE